MALQNSFPNVKSAEDWEKFFQEELNLSPDTAANYADELSSQNITGRNIIIGLSEPGFLNQFNMTIGHQLELKAKFSCPTIIKTEVNEALIRPNNKVPIPTVNLNITQLEFDQFHFEWQKYKEHYNIRHNTATSLFFCCSEEVRQQIRILQSAHNLEWTEDTLLIAIKNTVLSKTSSIVHVKQFLEIQQQSSETVQSFLQRLQAKASCCTFHCGVCKSSTVDSRVKEKFILGLKDNLIQRSILKTESIKPGTSLSDLLTEALTLEQSTREQESIASRAVVESTAYSIDCSEVDNQVNALANQPRNRSLKINSSCTHCGSSDHSASERRDKCPAWGKRCNNCQTLHHFKNMCLKPKRKNPMHGRNSVNSAEVLFIGEISSIQLPVKVTPEGSCSSVLVDVFPDTGANICLMGPSQLKQLKLDHSSLTPCYEQIAVAGGSTITSSGWVEVDIALEERHTAAKVYFAKRAKRFFLSRRCCRDLDVIPQSFPYPPRKQSCVASAENNSQTEMKRPAHIPFSPIESNIPALQKFLLDSFNNSVFEKDKPFPKLSTPPARIHLRPDHVVPKPAYWPATVAEHWAKEVKESIERDVEAGILKRVPFNEATEWCARMVVVRKKDGRPRRTVDFQQLNQQCLREPNHCESPFHAARKVPENTWKSVVDAVDGYHSVAIDEESSKLTTFITPWGRFRYLRFPQGHCAAGDAFNGRVQKILSHIPRMIRIVDDICIYDNTIEQAFWHMWDLLSTCAKHGIVLNKSKFQFCALDVNFAGLEITREGVKPSEKIMCAIRDFPPPTDITKARAFFGLVNQVQWAYANSPRMAPFRELVKPHSSFLWTTQHVQLFEESKRLILQQVEKGVRQYSTKRATCLQTDFCKEGIGYLLLQKFCNCSMDKAPLCCPEGWQLVFAGSRFTKGAEARYAPTEGEALAVAWALNHAHIFTKGCPNLTISTDHKPLLGILNERPMEEISNPRILRLKEQMLQFHFSMKYNQGKWHRAPDALSRNAVPSFVTMLEAFQVTLNEEEDLTVDESPEIALSVLGPPESMTLDTVQKVTLQDPEMKLLKSSIKSGFGRSQNSTDPAIRSFFNVREHLWLDNELVMFKNRIVIPRSLRQKVVQSLHSAHQGTEGMRARAANSVYWPGLNTSIAEIRKNCKFCNSIAPTQPREPLQPLPASPFNFNYPFQHICADAFELRGQQYLVVVDKFSGWLVLFHFKASIKARQIVDSFRSIFHTYGAPTILYSDGGLAFTSQETKDFLKGWGVEHNVSSAHYPQSNGRAELAVKTAKRIIAENVSSNGSLNTEATSRALL